MPTLLQRNARAIERATDAPVRARLRAQRAALLARHWHRDEVPAALAEAAQAAEGCADREAHAELELARALAQYYGGSATLALRHVRRALALAGELQLDGLAAECEAWAGGIAGTLREPPPAVLAHLRRAVSIGLRHRPVAAARAYYAAGAMWQEAGRIDAASGYYRRARQLARAAGDDQLVVAVSRYMTLMQVNHARRAHAAGVLDPAARDRTLADLGTAAQLADVLARDELGVQGALHQGEMRCIAGDHAGAIAIFEQHLDAGIAQGLAWEAAIAQADYALCLARCGRDAEAAAQAQACERALDDAFDGYSRAVVWGTLAELAAHGGDAALAQAHATRARNAWAEDADYGRRLRDCLDAEAPLG